MAQKLNRGFGQLRDSELDNKTQEIITAIQGGTVLALPNPSFMAVTTALTDFQSAMAMPPNTAARDAAVASTRAILEGTLQVLAATIELLPGMTDAQLATTGFDLRKASTHTSDPVAAPANVRLKLTGISGEVQVLCDSVARAKTYQVHHALDANAGPWTDGGIFGNTRSMVLNGLTRAKDYWVRVRAIGPDGPGGWSDPATILVA